MFLQHHIEILVSLCYNCMFISVLAGRLELLETVFFTCVPIVPVLETHLMNIRLSMVTLQGKYFYPHSTVEKTKAQKT